jgi:hypothetical protein
MAEAVEQLRSSEGWRRWLRVRRHFHTYSLHNQLLIASQMPEATRRRVRGLAEAGPRGQEGRGRHLHLGSITRRTVIERLGAEGTPVIEREIAWGELYSADECLPHRNRSGDRRGRGNRRRPMRVSPGRFWSGSHGSTRRPAAVPSSPSRSEPGPDAIGTSGGLPPPVGVEGNCPAAGKSGRSMRARGGQTADKPGAGHPGDPRKRRSVAPAPQGISPSFRFTRILPRR